MLPTHYRRNVLIMTVSDFSKHILPCDRLGIAASIVLQLRSQLLTLNR
jgi:hypothetical protein